MKRKIILSAVVAATLTMSAVGSLLYLKRDKPTTTLSKPIPNTLTWMTPTEDNDTHFEEPISADWGDLPVDSIVSCMRAYGINEEYIAGLTQEIWQLWGTDSAVLIKIVPRSVWSSLKRTGYACDFRVDNQRNVTISDTLLTLKPSSGNPVYYLKGDFGDPSGDVTTQEALYNGRDDSLNMWSVYWDVLPNGVAGWAGVDYINCTTGQSWTWESVENAVVAADRLHYVAYAISGHDHTSGLTMGTFANDTMHSVDFLYHDGREWGGDAIFMEVDSIAWISDTSLALRIRHDLYTNDYDGVSYRILYTTPFVHKAKKR